MNTLSSNHVTQVPRREFSLRDRSNDRLRHLLCAIFGERSAAKIESRFKHLFRGKKTRAHYATIICRFKDRFQERPTDPLVHMQFAEECKTARLFDLAYAEAMTSVCLGGDAERAKQLLDNLRHKLAPPNEDKHNSHFRLKTLADELARLTNHQPTRVMDVGGGHGRLAQYLHDGCNYCLVDPVVNKIDGTALPFARESFDFVVACHVLEHVPDDQRDVFLDNLLNCAKRGLVLLNPIHVADTNPRSRIQPVVEITNSSWAREHLECGLPRVEEVQRFADARGLDFNFTPNGTIWLTNALIYVDYFASLFPDRRTTAASRGIVGQD